MVVYNVYSWFILSFDKMAGKNNEAWFNFLHFLGFVDWLTYVYVRCGHVVMLKIRIALATFLDDCVIRGLFIM